MIIGLETIIEIGEIMNKKEIMEYYELYEYEIIGCITEDLGIDDCDIVIELGSISIEKGLALIEIDEESIPLDEFLLLDDDQDEIFKKSIIEKLRNRNIQYKNDDSSLKYRLNDTSINIETRREPHGIYLTAYSIHTIIECDLYDDE